MIQTFPSQRIKKWIVNYENEFLGHIIKAFNLDLFSRKGFVKTGRKIYPHTTQSDISGLEPATAFCKANIDDGDAEEREKKLWAVAGDKIIKSGQNDEDFDEDENNGFAQDETVNENSDLISVGDETEEDIEPTPYSVSSASEYAFPIIGDNSATKNSAVKWAQSFTKINGPLSKISIELKKYGLPADNLVISIQEDSGGEPSGIALFEEKIAGSGLTTSFVEQEIKIGEDIQLSLNKTYWLVLERDGSGDISNYYLANLTTDKVYENGEIKNYTNDNGWKGNSLYAKTEIVSASGNWAVPTGVTEAIIEAWGGGGGGLASMGGGGGAAYARKLVTGLTPAADMAIVIGAGGASTGADGEDTTFDVTVVVANGGKGQTNGGGGGRTASSTGDVLFAGGAGEQGNVTEAGGASAGDRGAASGATAGTRNGIIQRRTPGGGGGSTGVAGYTGGAGIMRITYFTTPTAEYPFVTGRSWQRNSTAGKSHTITFPEDVIAGELLILIFGVSQLSVKIEITTPTGWTQVVNQERDAATVGVYYKRATGEESTTVTTDANCSSSHIVLRVKNAGTPEGTGADGLNDIDPPKHDTGVSAKYLWLACGVLGVGIVSNEITVPPANYESFAWIKSAVSPVAGAKSAITVVSERFLETDSEDPGTFTNDTGFWAAATIAIPYKKEVNTNDLKAGISLKFLAAYERLYLTTSKDIRFLNEDNGNWQSLWRGILQQDDLNDEYPAILKSLGSGGTLILGNDNKIHTMIATADDTTEVTEDKLIFDPTHFVNWIRVTSSAVFIGLQHKEGELLTSMVVYYEPYVERTRIYQIEEGATMGFIIGDNCHILDKSGQVRQFTGASFTPYQYFPPYYRKEKITKLPHRNGVIVRQGIVKFLWEGQYPDPAGVWVLENGNLYHENSLVFNKTILNSLGAIEVDELGALFEEDEIFMGASVVDGNGSEIKGVYSTAEEQGVSVASGQRTQIVTAKLVSPYIYNIWQDIVLKYDPVDDGKFVVKQKKEAAKITEGSGADEFNGEWTADDSFTCSDIASDVDGENIEVGDEIIVRKGQGAGLLAHITKISGTTTKTITIDEGLAAISSGKFTFSVEKWEKITFNAKDTKFSRKASLKDDRLGWKQIKVDIREHDLEEIQIQSVTDKTLIRK